MKKIFLIAIFLTLSLNLYAQDNGNKLLKSVQNKFEKINDLTVDVVQMSGGKEMLSGKLSYKKEDKFYLDMKNNLIVSDGFTIWNYNKKKNKVIINEVDKSDPSYFSFTSIVYDYPSQCYISSEKNGEVLVFTPKEDSNLNFSKARLWVNGSDFINKLVLENVNTEAVEINFSNYRLNQNLADSKFKFIPPEGSTVIDLR